MTERLDIGAVVRLRIDVLSDAGWADNAQFEQDIADAGGGERSQYEIAWHPDNARGYAALLTFTMLDGGVRRLLVDAGWDREWMDAAYARHGVDRMLEAGEIDGLVLTHWHLDHFWGIESVLKHAPDLRIHAPATWCERDRMLLCEGASLRAFDRVGRSVVICQNRVPHRGALVLTNGGGEGGDGIYRLMPGVALRMFEAPMRLRCHGENVLFVHVKDRGLVTVTGCGHPGIGKLLRYARDRFSPGVLYGCYGGLHFKNLAPGGPQFDAGIDEVAAFGLRKVACNHCTGEQWIDAAEARGVPVVRWSGVHAVAGTF